MAGLCAGWCEVSFGRAEAAPEWQPCSLCGKPASGRFGLRVADHRYIVCSDRACQCMPASEARKRLAELAAPPESSKPRGGYTWANKGVWRKGGPRCKTTAGCALALDHRGKCYLKEK